MSYLINNTSENAQSTLFAKALSDWIFYKVTIYNSKQLKVGVAPYPETSPFIGFS
jgi:hypothetical protein